MSRVLWCLPWMLLLWVGCAGVSCGADPQPPPPKQRPKGDLKLLVLTDPKGYLEPCGCQQRPLGGLDKLASLVSQARAEGSPTLLLAAGDLTYGVELHKEDAEAALNQERWRAETLVDVWSQLGMSAVSPGELDFAQGEGEQRRLSARSRFPWLLENAVDAEGQPLAGLSKAKLIDAGGITVGVFGLLAPSPTLKLPTSAALDADLAGVAKRASEALRNQGARLVIALVDGDRRAAREVASSGPDVVVMGGVDHEDAIPPSVAGDAIVVHAGRQGQRLVTIDLELSAQGEWHDASAWTQVVARRALETRIQELRSRVQQWESDPKVKASDLSAQKARIKQLEAELTSHEEPSFSGRWFRAEVKDLAPEVEGDKAIAAVLDAYDRRVNAANGQNYVAPEPAAEGSPFYAGSESCKSCHEQAYAWWRNTKHGRAYATLVERNKQFDLSCVGCHVVGYNKPGGSTVTHVERLKDVGCESCHGPGSQHNLDPEKGGLVVRDTPQSVCVTCHNHEHSPRFQYDAFRSLLIVPGHGLPASGGGPKAN